MAASFQSGAVSQPCELLAGCSLPKKGTSFSTLSHNAANDVSLKPTLKGAAADTADDLQQMTPARGRLGLEEIPYLGHDPVPTASVPPPPGGWGPQSVREDSLRRFTNRSTQGLDGGGRSTNVTRFQVQVSQWQQPDDSARHRMFERNTPSSAKTTQVAYP